AVAGGEVGGGEGGMGGGGGGVGRGGAALARSLVGAVAPPPRGARSLLPDEPLRLARRRRVDVGACHCGALARAEDRDGTTVADRGVGIRRALRARSHYQDVSAAKAVASGGRSARFRGLRADVA